MSHLPARALPPLTTVLVGPLLLLIWGFATGVLLWGSGVDVAIQLWLHANYDQDFNTVMRWLGEIGKGGTQAALCVVFAAGWGLYEWRYPRAVTRCSRAVLFAVPVFAVAGCLNWVMKWSIGRGRPKEFLWNDLSPYAMKPFAGTAQWWSFPSGHSCSAFAIAVWLGFVFPKWRYSFWLMAAVVSFSRFLSLTPHYLGDVVAGAALGASVAWAAWIILVRLKCGRHVCHKNGVHHG